MGRVPARDALEVLDWVMSRHVHEYLDVDGRPVGEGRADAFKLVQTEMQTCPYAGSRHRHARPMNVSALRQMLPAWDKILTMLSWLGSRHRARHREVATYDDLSLVVSAGAFLADFLALRRHRPLRSGEVPVLISGLYKVCLGFQLATLLASMQVQSAGRGPGPLPDAAGFLDYLEAQGLLIGEAEVCSGSPAMIMQAYDAMTDRKAVEWEDLPPECAPLDIDWERFDDFTHHASYLWSELVQYVLQVSRFCPELDGDESRLPPEVRHRLNACLKRRATELLAEQAGLVVDIARGVQEHCGPPAAASPLGRPVPVSTSGPQPGGLAEAVLEWLHQVAPDDMRAHAPAVARALREQLAPYDQYEAGVLAAMNEHVGTLMFALGLGPSGAALKASALSRVCGRALCDWGLGTSSR
jgi:hypothetical protein